MTHSGFISPLQFGAVGDGRHSDTAAMQRAIDACAQAGNGEPFAVSSVPRTPDFPAGHIRGVSFRDIDAESDNAVILHGHPGHPVEDIELTDVRLRVHRRDNPWLPESLVDLRPTTIDGGVHPHDGHALICMHARDMHVTRLTIQQLGWPQGQEPVAVIATNAHLPEMADSIDVRHSLGASDPTSVKESLQ